MLFINASCHDDAALKAVVSKQHRLQQVIAGLQPEFEMIAPMHHAMMMLQS